MIRKPLNVSGKGMVALQRDGLHRASPGPAPHRPGGAGAPEAGRSTTPCLRSWRDFRGNVTEDVGLDL